MKREPFQVLLSADERARIEAEAKLDGISTGAFIRHAATSAAAWAAEARKTPTRALTPTTPPSKPAGEE